MSPLKLCVLISGTGTNLQALINARAAGRLCIDIVHVISNIADVSGLEKAHAAGLPCTVLDHDRLSRESFDEALALLMATGEPDLHVFAGFMRIVGDPVLQAHKGRMINLHPSLLPKYPGLNTYRRAIDAGDVVHGASMHFLTAELDGGPVISQVEIPLESGDDSERLQTRLAPQEHRLVVATIELFQRHKVECDEDRVLIDQSPLPAPLMLNRDGTLHVDRQLFQK